MITRLNPPLWVAFAALLSPLACGDDSSSTGTTDASATATATASSTSATSTGSAASSGSASASAGSASESESAGSSQGTTSPTTGGTTGAETTTGAVGCGACDQPNQACVDDECVTLCQGQDPDPCGPDQVCDVISGECKDPGSLCTLSGPASACGDKKCGPGTVCDGVGECLPIAPCAVAACTEGGDCWGSACTCTREKECDEASEELLNGPFSEKIAGLDFADDCTAWMVTLRDGTDYLRRLRPDGELTEWPGVSNLDMGEVKVLRRLTVPQATRPPSETLAAKVTPPQPVEGYGEVALTYICCANCGCALDPPQGVARLVEEDQNQPLPLVITATTTQGSGPFMSILFDAGPQGLTWGQDRVLYVGKRAAADNVLKLQDFLTSARARTASVTRLAA